ncbi:MAG: NYN domain-containing protein [Candidatus Omnitrophota bacterium]|nr:NYN domain-containing protein [Candidatus Omnitrophota bacterium]
MSLQYIIDAYNLINHPAFKLVSRSALNIQQSLADFIRLNRLTGSKNNRLVLVFDGYPPRSEDIPCQSGLVCMFSRAKEADELIKKIVQDSVSPENIIVVSDDKEVQLTSRFFRAQICSVKEFICDKKEGKSATNPNLAAVDFKLSYAKMQKINVELRKKWLEGD